METTTTPPSIPGEPAPLSLAQRIWGIFVSPTVVLADLRARPHVLGALLILVVLSLGAGFLIRDLVAEEQMSAIRDNPDLTEESLQQAEAQQKVMRVATPFMSAGGAVIGVLIVTGVLLLLGNVALGGSAAFKTMFAATAHIFLVSIPETLVKVPLMLSQQTVNVQTSLAAFLPADGDKNLLYFALAQIDLFGLWRLALSVLAVAIIAGVEFRKAATGVVMAWVLWSAAWVPIQAALSGLSPS